MLWLTHHFQGVPKHAKPQGKRLELKCQGCLWGCCGFVDWAFDRCWCCLTMGCRSIYFIDSSAYLCACCFFMVLLIDSFICLFVCLCMHLLVLLICEVCSLCFHVFLSIYALCYVISLFVYVLIGCLIYLFIHLSRGWVLLEWDQDSNAPGLGLGSAAGSAAKNHSQANIEPECAIMGREPKTSPY